MSRQRDLGEALHSVVKFVTAKSSSFEEELRKRETAHAALRLINAAKPAISQVAIGSDVYPNLERD